MRGSEVRSTFLNYFAGQGHRIVRSSSLVPGDDPTLLFTNAGMNQFKDVFLGRERREERRAASAQKCLRVSGKHNDLEQVGRTARHHTFFEMLGNFSFGDYFKAEAVRFAWDLMTRVLGVDPSRLTATIFAGEEGLPADDEARGLWRQIAGLPDTRILSFGAKDNFWRMGETGPCGPCSELHYDQGPGTGCGRAECAGPACDCDRFLEVWNLVFMQFDQKAGGSLEPLPAPSIDTGMGLERITAVLQGRRSNYETDLFVPLLEAVAGSAGVRPGEGGAARVSLQVIADHLRAISFLIADGVQPSNDGRGYVLRRVLRRAFRHGRTLGQKGPFLHSLTAVVVDMMGDAYPELRLARQSIEAACRAEEERFEETLSDSLRLLDESFTLHAGARRLPGDELFRLYDTFGLPFDLAEEMAGERGFVLDREGFHAAMEAQRQRARESWKGAQKAARGEVYTALARRGVQTVFLGYATAEAEATVRAILGDGVEVPRLEAGSEGALILDRTTLYAEAGGQVGEHGLILGKASRALVLDTSSPVPGVIVHRVRVEAGGFACGDLVRVACDADERAATRRNHTATHLLHAVLKSILGPHVKQAGSLVAPERLRFDFTHYRPLSAARLREVEELINRRVLDNRRVETRTQPLDEALASGAVAMFGEKYGARVRVVSVPEFSTELCGGLHCAATGDIGLFRLVSERGVAAGVRRLEAVTGLGAMRRSQADAEALEAVAEWLGVPRDGVALAAERAARRIRELQRDLDGARLRLAGAATGTATQETDIIMVDGLRVLARRIEDLDMAQMRQLADRLKRTADVVVLGTARDDRVALLVAVREEVSARVPARRVVDRLARVVGGGGGGRDTLAEAGGRDASRLDEALRLGVDVVRELLAAGPERA